MSNLPSFSAPSFQKEEYWKEWLSTTEESEDPITKSLHQVIEVAVDCKQYERPNDEFEDVKRVVKFRIPLARDVIHQIFGIKTYSIYGVGLYTVMEGLLLSEGTRSDMNYDTCHKKGVYLDLSSIPEEVVKTHEFRLAVPAFQGLFVPKKTRVTDWIRGTYGLQYFDMML